MDTGLLCCLGTRRRARAQRSHVDGGGEGEASTGFLRATCACCTARHRRSSTSAVWLKTPTPRRWMRGMSRVFARSPPCDVATATAVELCGEEEGDGRAFNRALSREHVAAATIQAYFRRHLARRAFRALRSLVKVQAFARGSYVRKQVDAAIRCMKVLVRLQVRVRARQLLDVSKDQ